MGQKPTGPASDFSLRVVAEIERARHDAGITARELIKRSTVGANTYFTKMRGDRPFNTNEIDLLAGALGVEPELILRKAAQPGLAAVSDVGGMKDPLDLYEPGFSTKPADLGLAAKTRKPRTGKESGDAS